MLIILILLILRFWVVYKALLCETSHLVSIGIMQIMFMNPKFLISTLWTLASRLLLIVGRVSSTMSFDRDSGAFLFISCLIPVSFLNFPASVFHWCNGCPTSCVVGLLWGKRNRPTSQGGDPLLVQVVLIRILLVFEKQAGLPLGQSAGSAFNLSVPTRNQTSPAHGDTGPP